MAITPIHLFTPAAETNAAAAAIGVAGAGAAPNVGTTTPAAATTFSAVLGQLLAELGPLAFDNSLTNIGGSNSGSSSVSGFTGVIFDLLLFNSLGLDQVSNQPTVQQLLLTQLLFSATDTTDDTTGLGSVASEDVASTLAEQEPTTNNFLTQLTNVSTQPNPIIFSAAALAQAFQIGNGTGSPA